MTYWRWVPGLETGLEEIDRQHQEIVRYINALHQAVVEKNDVKTELVLEKLMAYTLTHFRDEEAIMERAGYEYLSEHRLLHEAFKVRVGRYRKRISDGEDVTAELLKLLVAWLVRHIREEDKKVVAAIGTRPPRKGIKATLGRLVGIDR